MRLRLFTMGLLAAVLGSMAGCGQGVIGDTEADEIPDGLDRMIRERLQVQVAITALPPGTMASSEQKTKRIWRRYAGEDPGW